MAPDANVLRSVSKENLSRALRLKRGKKILVIDPKLVPTLDLIANYRFLQDHGVEKIVHLSAGPPMPSDSVNQVLYFIRADIVCAKIVCDQITNNISRGISLTYGVVVVPRLLHIITALFESEGIYEHVSFGQYAYEMIPLEDNIFSLEMDDVVPQLWLHQDTSMLASVAKAIFNIRGIYGDFHHVVGIGPYAKSVLKMQTEFERIHSNNLRSHNRQEADIPTLILVDRALDFVSPLLIPLSYEAVLDEVFGIKGKTITFGADVTGKEPVKHNLTTDPIFDKVRNLHFSQVVSSLLAKERDTRRLQDESAGLNLQAMKNFVAKDLHKIQSLKKTLALHFGAFEMMIDKNKSLNLKKLVDLQENILDNLDNKETLNFLEDSMSRELDFKQILRLFCLCTLAQDGLRDLKSLTTQFVQSYGFKHLISLHNLEAVGLLYNFTGIEANVKGVAQVMNRVASSSPFSSSGNTGNVKKQTMVPYQNIVKKLAPSSNVQVDVISQNHPSYIFNGKYTPLVAKLTEEIISILIAPKMNSALIERKLEDLMKMYNVTSSTVKCKSGVEAYGRGRNVLVFVIGGISRGEIAALQVVAKNLSFNIICGGTDITNGTKLVSSLIATS
ncbi:vacuolar protein sorting-associated protein 33B [Folsomia candida]|uniref:vacuolar protein sorting-associated protein 33B n=1 Tax=Folsomia candida TaxID=158441 RepID=UPI000B901CFB|nr:vacuolar protein sorting-associated protein 33B [Folsomia candida]